MKRFILFVLCLSLLSGLHAKEISDTANISRVKVLSQQKEQKASDSSAAEPTFTPQMNMANNSLSILNNQITGLSIFLTIISIVITVVGFFGASWIKRFNRRLSMFEKCEESQRQKNEIMADYIGRLNDLLFKVSMEIANNNSGTLSNREQHVFMDDVYVGYYLIRLSVINVPEEGGESEEKRKALFEINQAIFQLIEKGGQEDLKVLQAMRDIEINKEKKKMLKKAAEDLQDRLLKKQ